jgi:Fe-S cluster assembly protein SufD
MSPANLDTQYPTTVAGWMATADVRAQESGEPAWALERRRRAAQTAASLAFPSREDELWRRTDFASLSLENLDPAVAGTRARNLDDLPAPLLARLAGESGPVALVAQADRDVILEQTHPELQRRGVILCSMERAMREHARELEPLLGSLIATDYDRWTAMGEALRSGGAFVWVPAGVQAKIPIRLMQWIDGEGRVAAPRTVVALGDGASATVTEEMLSPTGENASLQLGGTELFLGSSARLTFASLQDWGRNVVHYANGRAKLGADAELHWIQVMLGGRMSKTNIWYDLAGRGAQAYVHGFMFGDQRQHFHLHTLQRHLMPDTTSDLLIKGCLRDRARSVYQGLIQVAEGAQKTNAYQANRNLLLSEQARADSIPGLEILANDVRCTHGATIGYVDPEQMYYLLARGLSELEARRLIVEAFFEPVLDRIPLVAVREQLRDEIARKIGTP